MMWTRSVAVATSIAAATVIGTAPMPAWASYGQMRLGGLLAMLLLLALLLLLAWVLLALCSRWFRQRLLAWPTSLLAALWWGLLFGQWSDLQALLRWTPGLLALLVLLGIGASGLFVLLAPLIQTRHASGHGRSNPPSVPVIEDSLPDRPNGPVCASRPPVVSSMQGSQTHPE